MGFSENKNVAMVAVHHVTTVTRKFCVNIHSIHSKARSKERRVDRVRVSTESLGFNENASIPPESGLFFDMQCPPAVNCILEICPLKIYGAWVSRQGFDHVPPPWPINLARRTTEKNNESKRISQIVPHRYYQMMPVLTILKGCAKNTQT